MRWLSITALTAWGAINRGAVVSITESVGGGVDCSVTELSTSFTIFVVSICDEDDFWSNSSSEKKGIPPVNTDSSSVFDFSSVLTSLANALLVSWSCVEYLLCNGVL